ncbi:MAG: pyridoxal phosphate-dependent aminotransferase family protein, partial [Planctomycetota bacterium]|nr:pyridoxal phosphate-dependent aminotransferase family protein [Planctomycetota bacterium]
MIPATGARGAGRWAREKRDAMGRVNFAGNDYLGLAGDPRLADALCRAARRYGISATSSRWALGWRDIHQRLEEELAAFMGTGAACILGAAYFGGPVYFSVFAGSGRTVYCDENCHSNLFLGMRAAGLEIRTFRHLDAADLSRLLAAHRGPPPIIATDGVYGISGETAPLAELHEAATRAGAELLVDDAHGVGVLGASGRGSLEAAGVLPSAATVLGSMSKAMGAGGGFLAGRVELVEKFRRSAIASGSAIPPPPIAAACLEALRIIRSEPELRRKMGSHAARMRSALAKRGIRVV